MNLNEVDKPVVKKTIVVYAGRFQPFHKGHYDAYRRLVSKFGTDSVYIGTSNDQSSSKSPFGFKEKKEIATKMFGIPSSKFVQINNPYKPVEILKKFDGKTTQYIAAVGEKDATRLQGNYFKPYKGKAGYGYDEIGYVYPVPAEANPISGTDVRKGLGNSDNEKAKKFFLKAYPKFDKDIFKMIKDKLSKLNEEGLPGGIGTGLVLPGGYINGAPTGSANESNNTQPSSKMRPEPHPTRHEREHPTDEPDWHKKNEPYDPISEIIQNYITNEMFEEFVRTYFNEESDAEKMGLKHLGGGYYGKDDKGPATHKSEDGKIRALTPAEADAQNKKTMAKGPADAPANAQNKKPDITIPGQKPGTVVKKSDGKPDLVMPGNDKKTKNGVPPPPPPPPPPPQQLGGVELQNGAEERQAEKKQQQKKDQLETNSKKPAHKLSDEEAHEQIKHEMHDMNHEEKQAYKFLDEIPDEEKAAAIDKALKNRTWKEKFFQDTIIGNWLDKKGDQFANTGRGVRSMTKGVSSGRGMVRGVTEDCSGAPAGPHTPKSDSVNEAASHRQKYLASLDKDGNKPKQTEPVDKSKCKDVHYSDYQKRDENGEPMYEEKEEPVYHEGKKPDPKWFLSNGDDQSNVGPGGPVKTIIDPQTGIETEIGEPAFNAKELDSKTGYFKRNEKYYDKNGEEVDKDGRILDKDGNPKQKKSFFGKPKTRKVKTPVYEDNLTLEQRHAAEHSHHQSHVETHAMLHTAMEVTAVAASVAVAPVLGALGVAPASAGAAHGGTKILTHVLKDIAQHSAMDVMGLESAQAGVAGLSYSTAHTFHLVEEIQKNNPENHKEFIISMIEKVLERMKTYKMTPQQKLQSIRTYKIKQKINKQKEKVNNLKDLVKENISETKQKSIQHFVEYATRRLKLKETPKVTLLSGKTYSENQSSLGGYNPETKEIYVQIENRLGADILRTIAHEMVHRKQDEMGLVKNPMEAGKDGSPIENQAHAVAGILMREYGRINKQIYTETIKKVDDKYVVYPKNGGDRLGTHDSLASAKKQLAAIEINKEDINLDVDKGDTVLMGKFKNKKVQVKDIGKDDYGMPTINGKKATTFRLGSKAGEKINEMGRNDIHLKNLMKKYRDASFRKRINAYLFGKPTMNNPSEVAKRLLAMNYDEITQMEKKLNIHNPDLDETINKIVEVSSLSGEDDQANGAYLPKGKARKLGADDGTNKGDDWYVNGGYIQTDFPVADAIYGDEDQNQLVVKYSAKNLPRSDKRLQTDFPLSKDKVEILNEGGAYGHMSHPFDDMDLTFGDLKNIITNALDGELGVTREKTDGQALAISWKNGRLIAARNKGNLANAGANAMGIEGVASKFAGRGGLTDAYNFAMKDLSAAISALSQKQREKIFGEGTKFMNIEVIWPSSVNVIPYGQALLVFHNCIEYDEKGTAIGKVDGAESMLAGMIKQVNANVQSKYTIQGPPITSIPKNENLSSKKGAYLSKLNKLQSEFGCSDSDTMAVYHQHWWENFIDKNSPAKVDKITKDALIRRWAFGDKSFRLNTISNPKIQEWVMDNDKVNVIKQQKDNIRPFEEIFLGVGADVLQFVGSVLTVHPDKAIRSMKDKLKSVASQVRTAGNPTQIKKLKTELARLNQLGGIDKIVANEGLVFFYNGKTYKLTGTFAPLNQILGIFYE